MSRRNITSADMDLRGILNTIRVKGSAMLALDIENIKGLLITPVESFERLRSSSLTQAYRQYIILLIFYSVLLGIVSIILSLMMFSSYQVQLGYMPYIGSFLGTKSEIFKGLLINWNILLVYLWFLILMFIIFLKGLFLHVFVILLGGEQGVHRTLLAILYAATPFLLIGWIPYIGTIGLIWSVILCIIGIKILQELSWSKAAATIIIPLLLIMLGAIFSFIVILSFIGSMYGII